MTEFLLIQHSGPLLGGVILLLLFAVFSGMSQIMIKMCMGEGGRRPQPLAAATGEKLWPVPLLTALLALAFGIMLTVLLDEAIKLVAR